MPEGNTPQRDKVPTQRELDEAIRPLHRDAPLKDKFLHLHRALELADSLDAIALDAIALQEPLDPPSLRLAAEISLGSVISFLDSVNLESRTLRSLLQALYSLNEGHVLPLVTPPETANRRPDSTSMRGFKAMAAAAMELLMGPRGLPKKQAASWVARALSKTPFKEYGGKPVTASMVKGWRDKCIGHIDESDREAAKAFRTMVEMARAKHPTPEKQAQSVIDLISSMAPARI